MRNKKIESLLKTVTVLLAGNTPMGSLREGEEASFWPDVSKWDLVPGRTSGNEGVYASSVYPEVFVHFDLAPLREGRLAQVDIQGFGKSQKRNMKNEKMIGKFLGSAGNWAKREMKQVHASILALGDRNWNVESRAGEYVATYNVPGANLQDAGITVYFWKADRAIALGRDSRAVIEYYGSHGTKKTKVSTNYNGLKGIQHIFKIAEKMFRKSNGNISVRAAVKPAVKAKPWPKGKRFPWPWLKKIKLTPDQERALRRFITDDGDGNDTYSYRTSNKGERGYSTYAQLEKKGMLTSSKPFGDTQFYLSDLGNEVLTDITDGQVGFPLVEEDAHLDPETGVTVRVFGDDVTDEGKRVAITKGSSILFTEKFDTIDDIFPGNPGNSTGSAKYFFDTNRDKVKLPKAKAAWKLDSEHDKRGMKVRVFTHPNKKEIKMVTTSPSYPKPTSELLKPNDPRIPRNLNGKSLAEKLWMTNL